MICRYCGEELKSQADNLVGKYGQKCTISPSNKHVCAYDGEHCVYCGKRASMMGGNLRTNYGIRCHNSPTGSHSLD